MPRCFATSTSQHRRISALTFKLVTAVTFHTRDGCHVVRMTTHIVDSLQVIQIRDGLYSWNSNAFQLCVVHFQLPTFPTWNDPYQLGKGIS